MLSRGVDSLKGALGSVEKWVERRVSGLVSDKSEWKNHTGRTDSLSEDEIVKTLKKARDGDDEDAYKRLFHHYSSTPVSELRLDEIDRLHELRAFAERTDRDGWITVLEQQINRSQRFTTASRKEDRRPIVEFTDSTELVGRLESIGLSRAQWLFVALFCTGCLGLIGLAVAGPLSGVVGVLVGLVLSIPESRLPLPEAELERSLFGLALPPFVNIGVIIAPLSLGAFGLGLASLYADPVNKYGEKLEHEIVRMLRSEFTHVKNNDGQDKISLPLETVRAWGKSALEVKIYQSALKKGFWSAMCGTVCGFGGIVGPYLFQLSAIPVPIEGISSITYSTALLFGFVTFLLACVFCTGILLLRFGVHPEETEPNAAPLR